MNFKKFFDWLKQPSTVKAFIIILSLSGTVIAPERLTEILMSAGVVYAGIAAFLQKS